MKVAGDEKPEKEDTNELARLLDASIRDRT